MSHHLSNQNESNPIAVYPPLTQDTNNTISIASGPSFDGIFNGKILRTAGGLVNFSTTPSNLVTMGETNQCGILSINSGYSSFGNWYCNFSKAPGTSQCHFLSGSNMTALFSNGNLLARTNANSASMRWSYFRLQ